MQTVASNCEQVDGGYKDVWDEALVRSAGVGFSVDVDANLRNWNAIVDDS